MMLTEQIKEEIRIECESYDHRQAACIDAMLIAQRHLGWLSDETICEMAEFLEMTVEEVDSLATFFNRLYRKPLGRHVILICDSVSCWVMGYDEIFKHFRAKYGIGPGETTPDGRFTLLPTQCLGACDRAPALMIGEKLYTNLDPATLDGILEEFK
jgi:NADH-quinone oxidoreductase subunit E